MSFFKNYYQEIIMTVLGVAVIGLYGIWGYEKFYQKDIPVSLEEDLDNQLQQEDSQEEIAVIEPPKYVDIKGAVSKPGVYAITSSSIVNDIIKMAGGFKSSAYTANINLSKKLTDQMVIYVYTKTEFSKLHTKSNEEVKEDCKCPEIDISSCINSGASIIENEEKDNNDIITNEEIKNLININNATSSELETLNGIGQAKAKSIIEYRTANGSFKTIEDIKLVSGISDSLYEKIKDFITV